jgi:hypothetical protein
MRILFQTKDQNAPVLGIPSFAQNLIGDAFAGESAWEYRLSGYRITVGYYHNVGRYVAFQKIDGSPLADADIHSVLGFMGPNEFWTAAADGTYAYHETVQGAPAVNASAWYSSSKAYLFAYAPGILVSREAIDARMPGGTSTVHHPKPPK